MKKKLIALLLLLIASPCFAQDAPPSATWSIFLNPFYTCGAPSDTVTLAVRLFNPREDASYVFKAYRRTDVTIVVDASQDIPVVTAHEWKWVLCYETLPIAPSNWVTNEGDDEIPPFRTIWFDVPHADPQYIYFEMEEIIDGDWHGHSIGYSPVYRFQCNGEFDIMIPPNYHH